jgi:hypothetical protein
MMMPGQIMHSPLSSQGPPQLRPPPMGPTPPMGPPPMRDYMQPGGFRPRPPSMGGAPGPYMAMPGTMVPGQHPYQVEDLNTVSRVYCCLMYMLS